MKRLLTLLFAALLLCSCANKSLTRYETLAPALEKGGFKEAIKQVTASKDKLYGSNSEYLYYYDLGVLHHYDRNFNESIKNLAQAEKIYEDLYTKSITNEAAAVVTNDNVRPYRARPFELLVMYEFQILNYLAKGDIDGALVEVKRAQVAMEALYQKDDQKVNDNGLLRYLSAIVYELEGEGDDAAISYYKTVKAYEEGKLKLPEEVAEFVTESLRKMDREGELKSLKMAAPAETPRASAVREKGQEIVVIGYAGHSPILGEMYLSGTLVSGGALNLTHKDAQTGRIRSYTFGVPSIGGATGGETYHIGFALPQKKPLKNKVIDFTVSVDGEKPYVPEQVLSVNSELEQNMEDEHTTTIVRTAIRVVVRTIAAQKAKSATNTSNGLLNLVKNVAVDIAQDQIEQADLRVGLFLPNSIYMTRIPVEPGTHEVSIKSRGAHGNEVSTYKFGKVDVKKNQRAFLFVPAIK